MELWTHGPTNTWDTTVDENFHIDTIDHHTVYGHTNTAICRVTRSQYDALPLGNQPRVLLAHGDNALVSVDDMLLQLDKWRFTDGMRWNAGVRACARKGTEAYIQDNNGLTYHIALE